MAIRHDVQDATDFGEPVFARRSSHQFKDQLGPRHRVGTINAERLGLFDQIAAAQSLQSGKHRTFRLLLLLQSSFKILDAFRQGVLIGDHSGQDFHRGYSGGGGAITAGLLTTTTTALAGLWRFG